MVDGAEDRARIVGFHERARPVIDGLARNGSVIRIHHAVDEAEEHPLGH